MNYEVLFDKIANAGILGVLLVLALMVIAYLFHSLIAEKDKQQKKIDDTNVVLKNVNSTMKDLLIEIERQPYDKPREKKCK